MSKVEETVEGSLLRPSLRLEITILTQYASAVTGAIGSLTSVASKLGWKITVWYQAVPASHLFYGYGCCLHDFPAFSTVIHLQQIQKRCQKTQGKFFTEPTSYREQNVIISTQCGIQAYLGKHSIDSIINYSWRRNEVR